MNRPVPTIEWGDRAGMKNRGITVIHKALQGEFLSLWPALIHSEVFIRRVHRDVRGSVRTYHDNLNRGAR
jgi:hypothetical protein